MTFLRDVAVVIALAWTIDVAASIARYWAIRRARPGAPRALVWRRARNRR